MVMILCPYSIPVAVAQGVDMEPLATKVDLLVAEVEELSDWSLTSALKSRQSPAEVAMVEHKAETQETVAPVVVAPAVQFGLKHHQSRLQVY